MGGKPDYTAKLVKGTAVLTMLGIYSYIVVFFFKLFVARHYGPDKFGLFVLAQTILGLLFLISTLGIKNSITRYIPYYKEKRDIYALTGYIRFIFSVPVLFSFLLAIVLFLFSDNIASFFQFSSEFSSFLKVIALALPIVNINSILRQIFLAENRSLHMGITYYIIEQTSLFLFALLFIYLKLDIFFIVIAMALAGFLSLIYSYIVYKLKISFRLSKTRNIKAKEWLSFSLPLFFTGIFAYFISWSDNLIIGKFLTSSQLGIYSIAYSLAIFLVFFQETFSKIFLPLVSENYAKKNHENISLLFRNSAAWTFGMTFPFFIVIIIFSRQILSVLFGPEFASGSVALSIIAVGVLINISTGLNKEIMILHKKTKSIFIINIFIALGNIMFNLILVPVMGIVGAAISSAVSIALQNLIFLYIASKIEDISFDWVYNLKFVVAGLPSVLIALYIFRLLIFNKILAILITGVVYIFVYIIFLLLIKTPTKEDIRIILMIEKKLGLNLGFIKRALSRLYK